MKLVPVYNPELYPTMSKYGIHTVVGNRSKKNPDKHEFFMNWLNQTYPNKYSDVKEGDYFILWNGQYNPVAMVQMKDERPDSDNRPTRLNDGSYLGISDNNRVVIVSKNIATAVCEESRKYWRGIMK